MFSVKKDKGSATLFSGFELESDPRISDCHPTAYFDERKIAFFSHHLDNDTYIDTVQKHKPLSNVSSYIKEALLSNMNNYLR